MLVLTSDGRDARSVARTLARREIAVVVPGPASAVEIDAYARSLGVPVRVENAAIFRATDLSTFAGRAAHAWRLLRLSHSLLTIR
jgi:hypothetical protein